MIYFLYGEQGALRKKLHSILDVLAKKRPDSELFRLTPDKWNEADFDILLQSQGLFDPKYIVTLDRLFEHKDAKAYIIDRLAEAAQAEHVFLIIEEVVDTATVKKIEKVAYKTEHFEEKTVKKEKPNTFALSDHLALRDRKKLWTSYLDLLSRGVAPEEMHGILFWQMKNILLASQTTQKSSGLSPFVYTKAAGGVKKFSRDELRHLSHTLVDIPIRVRRGEGDIEVFLEEWILGV